MPETTTTEPPSQAGDSAARADGAVPVRSVPSWWGGTAGDDSRPYVPPTVWGGGPAAAEPGTSTTSPARAPSKGLSVESGAAAAPSGAAAAPSGERPPVPGAARPPRRQRRTWREWWAGPIHESSPPMPRWIGKALLWWQPDGVAESATESAAESAGEGGVQALPRTIGDRIGPPLRAAKRSLQRRAAAALRGGGAR